MATITRNAFSVSYSGSNDSAHPAGVLFYYLDPPEDITTLEQVVAKVMSDETAKANLVRVLPANYTWNVVALVVGPVGYGARFSYSTVTRQLQIEADGDAARTLQVDRVDGVALVLANPGNSSLSSGKQYPAGPQTGQGNFKQEWTFGLANDPSKGIPQVPIRITFDDGYKYVFTPTDASKKTMFTASAGTGTGTGSGTGTGTVVGPVGYGARFSYSSSNKLQIEVDGDTTRTLQVDRVDGVTMSLANSGNSSLTSGKQYPGGPQTDQGNFKQEWTFGLDNDSSKGVPAVPIRITFDDGYKYVFTPTIASKKTMFTASAGTGTTAPGASTAIPSSYTAISATDRVEVRLNLKEGLADDPTGNGLAGGVFWISKPGGFNLSNGFIIKKSPTQWDNGRSLQGAMYLGTTEGNQSYQANGGTSRKTPDDPGIGNNPVEQGDTRHNSSKLLYFSKSDDGTLYTEMDPLQWDMNNVRTGARFKKWIKPVGNTLEVTYQCSTNEPVPNLLTSRSQELPCLWGAGRLHTTVYYAGHSPYTNANLTRIRLPDGFNSLFGDPINLSESWIALVGDDASQAIGLIFLDNNRAVVGKYGESWSYDDGSDGNSNYIGNCPMMIIDDKMTFTTKTIVVVGSIDEIRAAANANPYRPKRTPVYRFNKATRQGWHFNNCHDSFSANSDGWEVTFDRINSRIWSPTGAFYGSESQLLYINMTVYNGGGSTMYFSWHQPGQKEGDPANENNGSLIPLFQQAFPNGNQADGSQTLGFPVIADGQARTYKIDLRNNSKWKDKIIAEFSIGATFNGNSATPGQRVKMNWINTVDQAPS